MAKLTSAQRLEIIKRRGYCDDITGQKHPEKVLEIHHKNRDTDDNRGANLRVLTKKQHDELHAKYR